MLGGKKCFPPHPKNPPSTLKERRRRNRPSVYLISAGLGGYGHRYFFSPTSLRCLPQTFLPARVMRLRHISGATFAAFWRAQGKGSPISLLRLARTGTQCDESLAPCLGFAWDPYILIQVEKGAPADRRGDPYDLKQIKKGALGDRRGDPYDLLKSKKAPWEIVGGTLRI